MPRQKIYINPDIPYHISARCLNKEWFRVPKPEIWPLFEDYLHFLSYSFDIEIFAFVLMDNHFHMLCRAPKGNLSQAMNYFMRETSRWISKRSGRINQVYGGPFHKTAIDELEHFSAAYKYIYRNPVEAGLCKNVAEYPYSTLHGILGLSKLVIPAYDETLFSSDFENHLRWLNTDFERDSREAIRKALRKGRFEIGRNRKSKRKDLEII